MLAVFMWIAGAARTSSTAVAATAETTGRRSTRSMTADQKRESPALLRRRINGRRPFSTRSPSQAIIAGSTVSEPIIATATTIIAPSPSPTIPLSPAKNMPAIAVMTVRPETRTARPDVSEARWSAVLGS